MKRIDVAGLALCGLALLGLAISHPPRAAAARSYADASSYNRSITTFLTEHRDRLAGRTVAVFGVSGLSPWSQSKGAYLTRLLGVDVRWRVYVPATDIFYTHGTLPEGIVTVLPESAACENEASAVFVVFDERGEGAFASDCSDAMSRSHPPPVVERWWPLRVTPAMAAAGFDVSVVGRRLGSAVTVSVEGQPVQVVRADRGRLMTTTTPPLAKPGGSVAFDVLHRGRSVAQGRIEVASDR
jgi:hypothetical protein